MLTPEIISALMEFINQSLLLVVLQPYSTSSLLHVTSCNTVSKMGCCLAPMDRRPEDPSVVVYAPVQQLVLPQRPISYYNGSTYQRAPPTSGLAYVDQDIFRYKDNSGKELFNVYVKDIQSVSVQSAYSDGGRYMMPCTCCPCAGCPDGVLDIRGRITQDGITASRIGEEFHIGLAMPDPEGFMEKLNAEIKRSKMSF